MGFLCSKLLLLNWTCSDEINWLPEFELTIAHQPFIALYTTQTNRFIFIISLGRESST